MRPVLLVISLFKAFHSKELAFFSPSLFGSFNFELVAYKHTRKVTVFVINFLFDFLKLWTVEFVCSVDTGSLYEAGWLMY